MELSRNRARLLRRIATRRGREAEGVVLLEGPRVLATVLQLGAELSFVVANETVVARGTLPELFTVLDRAGVEVVRAPPALFTRLADTEAPQGVLGVAREPAAGLPPATAASAERCLVLDGVRDPGNVGTLARTAAGLGASRMLALDGTADPWGAKAVRASAGFVFALPVHRLPWDEAETWMREIGLSLLVADGSGEDVRRWLAGGGAGSRGWALLLGNEGSGPREQAVEAASARLKVPVPSTVESLNVSVAGSILLWALGSGREDPEVT